MNSTIDTVIPLNEIPIPKELLTISISSWQEAIAPLRDDFLRDYNQASGTNYREITDELVSSLGSEIQTVEQLDNWLEESYRYQMRQIHYYQTLLPYLMHYYAKHTTVSADEEEWATYLAKYQEEIQLQAAQRELTVKEYIEEVLQMKDHQEDLEAHAYETFVFHLIARHAFDEAGFVLDRIGYDEFVQHFVLHYLIDEIDFKQEYSYDWFLSQGPEFLLNQKWLDYYEPMIQFVAQV